MTIILHIARRDNWEKAEASGQYCADTLMSQGFIHCSTPRQIIPVANTRFRGEKDLVLLCIESEKVDADIRYENLEGGDDLFPHIYGSLNPDAVVDVLDFKPHADGTFALPQMREGDDNGNNDLPG
ncbi:MAG: DUF952 domain-containing protein [Anaerolineae bacterium]|nr:DUF952 domain-containing protein [Anaerolineae bacterium]